MKKKAKLNSAGVTHKAAMRNGLSNMTSQQAAICQPLTLPSILLEFRYLQAVRNLGNLQSSFSEH